MNNMHTWGGGSMHASRVSTDAQDNMHTRSDYEYNCSDEEVLLGRSTVDPDSQTSSHLLQPNENKVVAGHEDRCSFRNCVRAAAAAFSCIACVTRPLRRLRTTILQFTESASSSPQMLAFLVVCAFMALLLFVIGVSVSSMQIHLSHGIYHHSHSIKYKDPDTSVIARLENKTFGG
jgi:hypothetical protein